jgi:hypothetical protein
LFFDNSGYAQNFDLCLVSLDNFRLGLILKLFASQNLLKLMQSKAFFKLAIFYVIQTKIFDIKLIFLLIATYITPE